MFAFYLLLKVYKNNAIEGNVAYTTPRPSGDKTVQLIRPG